MGDVLQLFAESTATFRFDDGRGATAGDLVAEGCQVATWLQQHGVGRGDRVAARLPNGADYIRLLLACAAGGFVTVSVNPRYSEVEAAELSSRTQARTIDLTDPDWGSCRPIEPVAERDDPYVVFTTSGTTSRPKLVLHRQSSVADHARDAAAGFGYGPDDVVLAVMPFGGTFGLTSLMAAVAGGCHVVVSNYDTAFTAAMIADERVTCVNGSDDMFHRLLEHGADLSSVRLAGYGRFNTSLDGIVDRAELVGATLTGLYGMSEVQALYSLRDPSGTPEQRSHPGGTLVSPEAQYRVVDGELQLRGPSLFTGYLCEGGAEIDAELTARHYDDGWFRTGDLAEPEDDRTFEYLTRMGDVLRLGGFLVSPAEIEQVLIQLPGVEQAQVVSVDRPGGARPVAFVIAPTGIDEAVAIEHCGTRLARYKVPVRVMTLDEFPTTASANGTKIQKVRLRAIAQAALTEPDSSNA